MPYIFTKPPILPIPLSRLDPTKEHEVWSAKIDGAHTIGLLKKGQAPELYSHRLSRKDNKNISYNDKLTHLPKKSKVDAKVRFETYATDKYGRAVPPELVTAMLISKPENSLAMQRELGLKTQTAIIGVDKLNGIDYTKRPLEEQIEAIKQIQAVHPEFTIPDMAVTSEEKRRLLSNIKQGMHPHTKEGIIIHNLEKDKSYKAKIISTQDVHVRDIFPEEAISLDRAPMAGGFTYSYTPNGPIVGKVGTGFNHQMKRQMLENPDLFKGRVARIHYLGEPKEGGALIKPSFKGWDIDKNIGEDEYITPRVKTSAEDKPLNYHAIGLPKKGHIEPIVLSKDKVWEFVVQRHDADRAGLHYDLRIGDPETGFGHSWAVRKGIPEQGKTHLAVRQSTHTIPYFDFEGQLGEGYGKGHVETLVRDKAHIIHADENKVKFYLPSLDKTFSLINTKKNKNWLLLNNKENTIPTTKTKADPIGLINMAMGLSKIGMTNKSDNNDSISTPSLSEEILRKLSRNSHKDYIKADYPNLKLSPLINSVERIKIIKSQPPVQIGVEIPIDKIEYVSQHKFEAPKVDKYISNPDISGKHLEVVSDKDNRLHLLDGHHRYLGALKRGDKKVSVTIYDGMEKEASLRNKMISLSLVSSLLSSPVMADSLKSKLIRGIPKEEIVDIIKKVEGALPKGSKITQEGLETPFRIPSLLDKDLITNVKVDPGKEVMLNLKYNF